MKDAAAIAAIYRPYVEQSARIAATLSAGFPWLVTEEGGPQGMSRVVAYAYAGLFHKRPAYRHTVENSVYVAASHARLGIGTALMREIIARCTAKGFRQMVALISGVPDSASVKMHASQGFRPVGHLLAVGLKFGKWIDVVEMQLALGEGDATIPR